ncbi:MAG TPA: hypothetical protein VFE06_08520 [Acidobacteriaceae bacterium]|jgi:hypothetical protein|nr:hypothetical protein [Acidobacteriaceae bacterium]
MTALQRITLRMRAGWFLLFAAAFPFLTPSTHAQNAPDSRASMTLSTDNPGFADVSGMDPVRNRMIRNVVRERSALRQKAIVDDTAQLLDLAQRLKTAVDKSDKDQLSLKVIDTAAEIEKLAKTVREKMRSPD